MATKTAIVLGCSGQDGSLISKSLLEKGHKVIGISRKKKPQIKNLIKLGINNDIEVKHNDITNFESIYKLIEYYQPNAIFNLSAQSSVGKSFNNPIDTINSITNASLNILEVCRKLNYSGRIFFAGSSEMFGNTSKGADISHGQNPLSPYGIAKQSSFNLVKLYRDVYQLKCVTGVLFNHESNLRDETFVTQKIIKGAKDIIRSNSKSLKLKLGNIKVMRDWGWAPEYVEAIQLITYAKDLKDQVICTGKAISLELFIEKVFTYHALNWKEHIAIDKNFYRPNEIKKSYGNPKPLYEELGWAAQEKIDSIIKKLIELS